MQPIAKEYRDFVMKQDPNRMMDHYAGGWSGCSVGHFVFETGKLENKGYTPPHIPSFLEVEDIIDNDELFKILIKPSESTDIFPTYGDLQEYFQENE